ncbi:MAG: SDR family oxidoreductase [Pseudotabrizicola sp.]|uniref:SDR family oxidoreductase n=1 Tax=Pseudotabrizicola sp. TaxID=2939647 RepID=UPI00272FB1D9|nr:SDR family oxidoreductase [Pseudotabrizicola sp.]MDP2079597.1 SDR family oxidoreductase [Pseudotabrizicola sp.]MDZ7576366.1 SDR family oxidoreductase [Pseudotabrizicola sp.]
MNRIDGKIALVTGGTQGLGAAIARLFVTAGAAGVAIVGRDQPKGDALASEIMSNSGVPVQMITADLGEMADVMRVVATAEARFGRIDILVNAAGLTDRGNLLNTSPDLFDRIFAVNVRAPFFLMQEAVKCMARAGVDGRILNIGSASERAGQPFLAAYSASKGALATLTRNSGFALMRNRVRVNQLDIGWMLSENEKTTQLQESGDPAWQEKAEAALPFGRLLDPEEVAKAVLWMVSDDSGMMTGAVVHFDQSVWGGYDGQAPSPARPLE